MGSQMGRNMMGGRRNRRGGSGSGMGCMSLISVLIVVIFISTAAFMLYEKTGGGITPSTVSRTALSGASVEPGDVLTYEDATRYEDWFYNSQAMTNGANIAHNLTGVKFGIYVTDEINGNSRPSPASLDEFSDNLYEEWFGDSSGHLLIVLVDSGIGHFSATDIGGNSARTVFDDEAMGIFYNYLERYWNEPDNYDDSEMFGLALSNTAERIMSITPTVSQVIIPWIFGLLAIIAVFVGATVVLKANTKRKLAAAEQAKADAELLATPIDGLDGTPPSDPLLDKYKTD